MSQFAERLWTAAAMTGAGLGLVSLALGSIPAMIACAVVCLYSAGTVEASQR